MNMHVDESSLCQLSSMNPKVIHFWLFDGSLLSFTVFFSFIIELVGIERLEW